VAFDTLYCACSEILKQWKKVLRYFIDVSIAPLPRNFVLYNVNVAGSNIKFDHFTRLVEVRHDIKNYTYWQISNITQQKYFMYVCKYVHRLTCIHAHVRTTYIGLCKRIYVYVCTYWCVCKKIYMPTYVQRQQLNLEHNLRKYVQFQV
jgi:hypothetical protein